MTPSEAFPFHLCIRLGVAHPDHLYELVTAKQLDDWRRYHNQFCVSVGRDDPFNALSLAMYHNAHSDDDLKAEDFMLYCEDPRGEEDDEETQEGFVERIKALCPS